MVLQRLINSNYLKLTGVRRFSHKDFVQNETVAEHTIRCQLIALQIYQDLYKLGITNINIHYLMYKLLVHDLEESVMCDIPRDIKYYSEESLNLINDIALNRMRELDYPTKIITDIQISKNKQIEGKLVSIIDVFQCFEKLSREFRLQWDITLLKDLRTTTDTFRDKLEYCFAEGPSIAYRYFEELLNDMLHHITYLTRLSQDQ